MDRKMGSKHTQTPFLTYTFLYHLLSHVAQYSTSGLLPAATGWCSLAFSGVRWSAVSALSCFGMKFTYGLLLPVSSYSLVAWYKTLSPPRRSEKTFRVIARQKANANSRLGQHDIKAINAQRSDRHLNFCILIGSHFPKCTCSSSEFTQHY